MPPPPPDSTLVPTASPTPQATATPESEPPWVLAFTDDELKLMDSRGKEIGPLDAPSPWSLEVDLRPDRGISPNGWIAYRVSEDLENPRNLSLAIFQLPQQEPVALIPLLSPEVQTAMAEPEDSDEPSSAADDLYFALTGLWFKPRWSPDGRYLAFTAALDQPSTDVYMYDTRSGTISRRTDEPQEVMLLGWSPDGRWILYGETNQYGPFRSGYVTRHVRAVSLTDGEVRELLIAREANRVKLVEWISPTAFLLSEISNESGPVSLILCDLSVGRITRLYDEGFTWAAVDPVSGAIAYTSWMLASEPGLFVIPPGKLRARRVGDEMDSYYWGLISWSSEMGLFFAESDRGIISFGVQGDVREIYSDDFCLPEVSPDGRWLAFGACSQEMRSSHMLRVYNRSKEHLFEIPGVDIFDLVWQEDSQGFIYRDASADPAIYHVSIPDGARTPIDGLDDSDLVAVPIRETEFAAYQIELDDTFPTPFPTAAQDEAISAESPWWIGLDDGALVASNADGSGRVQLTSKRVWSPYTDLQSGAGISNSGRVGGRISTAWPYEPPLDLALMVYSLPLTTPSLELPLFSTDLQAAMDNTMDFQYEDGLQVSGPRWQYDLVYQSVLTESSHVAWSQDGRFLAFPAALEGTTSDLYLFDSGSGEVARLTRESENVDLLGWSPQADWLIYATVSHPVISHGGTSGLMATGVYAIQRDGGGRRLLYRNGAIENIAGWLSEQEFVVESWTGGPKPPHLLRIVRLTDGRVAWSFEGEIYDAAVSLETASLAVTARPAGEEDGDPRESDLFLYHMGGGGEHGAHLSETAPANTYRLMWSPALELFLASSEEGVFAFASSGETRFSFPNEMDLPNISPDGSWLAFETQHWDGPDEISGMRIYPAEGGPALTITENTILTSAWLADDKTLYYLEEIGVFTRLFSVQMPEANPILLHPEIKLQMPVLIQTD